MTEILDAQTAFTGTTVPEGKDAIDEGKLGVWMESNVEGFTSPVEVRKFAGGQSNPTYKLTTPSGSYVLRRKPLGPLLPSAHAVDREFKVISGLYPTGFPVAKPYALCIDNDVIGSWFYIMDMVEGRTIWDGAMPGSTPEERRATYFAMIDTLAALHSVDVEAAGLSDYGKPGNYFERQVSRWTKQYRAAETEIMPEMERLIEWLPQTLPTQNRVSIVHGDYRIDNMIFDAALPKVRAVLDWELGTLGDPLADFTYVAMAWVTDNEGRSGVQDLDRAALGIPELDEVVAHYCAATGRDGIPDLNWYFAFNFFRLAGIIQGIKKRVIEGTATSAHAVGMSERVYPLAQAAWHFANQAGAK
jgi:aminoglycoside phosphotransferase (APT) family kinase protein